MPGFGNIQHRPPAAAFFRRWRRLKSSGILGMDDGQLPSSEQELQRQLNLPGSPCRGQFARIGAIIGRARTTEIRVIDQVEELRSELNPGSLGELEVLEGREVYADVSRAAEGIAADVAELPVCGIRERG